MSEPHENVREAISFFEKMLQSMPDDRVSLEFLAGAYEQTGRQDKARAAWKQLAQGVLRARDDDQARSVRPRLEPYLGDPDLAKLATRLDALLGESPALSSESPIMRLGGTRPAAPAAVMEPAQLHMAAAFEEVNLAWLLHEKGFLDATEYESLTVELTEGSTDVPKEPVSALCGLQRLHPDACDAAVLVLADMFAIVPLRLDAFEIDPAVLAVLPAVFVRIKGTIPFAKLGRTLLVALLNPADRKLRAEVEALAGMPCTFYLAHPANLATALGAFPVVA
jgi:hypothetical protein